MSLATSTPLPTLLFAAFATLTVAGCGVTARIGGDTITRVEDDTIPVDDIHVVDIRTDNGSVEVRGGGGDDITVVAALEEHHDGDAESSVDVDDGRLLIDGTCDARWWDPCSVVYVVTVPSDFEVRVVTDNGRVDVSQIDGDVDLSTDNGAIAASDLGSDTVVTSTDNGRIRLTFEQVPTSVETTTDNGAIVVALPQTDDGYAVDASTDNGHVAVDVVDDPASDRHITARSDNGRVSIEYRTA